MEIGHKLKRIRENKRILQQEIANLLDVSQKTYSNIESDKSEPSLAQLSKLAEVLEFNLLDILTEQGIVFNQSNNKIRNNGIIHNNLPDSLIAQYKSQIKDKETIIKQKEDIIVMLKEKIIGLDKK